jgi:threonine/homoserine/homoserine lactone efflux protein
MSDLLVWITFGLVAGLAPGPLLMLVISETVQHGRSAGIKVAISPLIADAPILALSYFAVSRLTEMDLALGILSIVGALFIAYLALKNLQTKNIDLSNVPNEAASLKKGTLTNLLNPHPYVFWFSIGAPLMLNMLQQDIALALLAMGLFYFLLVGSKVVIAVVVASSRGFLKSSGYRYTLRVLGLILLVFAGQFLWQGLGYLGVM